MKFSVVFFNAFAFINGAARAAHTKAQVPHGAGKFRNERTELFLGFLIFKEKQDVQIGIREQHLAAVAAQRQQRKAFIRRFVHPHHVAEGLVNGIVGELAKPVQRGLGRGACIELRANPLAFRFHFRNENT